MDEIFRQLLTVLSGMWRRRWIGIGVAWIVAVIGSVIVVRIPERYEANARIFVDTQTILRPLMSGLAIEPDTNLKVAMLARTLITRPSLEKLVRSADLDHLATSPAERERLIDTLARDIRITGSGRENLYDVSYRDARPERAKLIVQTLVSLFVESGLGDKRRDTEDARRFIDEQIKVYEARLKEAENRVKEFKLRNLDVSDGAGKDYFGRIASLTEELSKARLELRVAEQSRDALRHQLEGEVPDLLVDASPAGANRISPELDARIEAQRRQLDELLRRYTDEHPDVAATRRLIASLEEQKKQEVEARRIAAAKSSPKTAATNPVFQQIKIALAEAESNVAALRARVNDTQVRLNQLRAAAGQVPKIEAEMAQLNRDYDIIKRNYDALVARREQASMSEDVNSGTRLAEFRVIEPPRVLPKPVFPNRLALVPLVLLAAIGAGLAAAFGFSQLFPTVDSARMLRSIAQRPVLGNVSLVVSESMMRRTRKMNTAFAGSVGGLFLVFGAWIVWISLSSKI